MTKKDNPMATRMKSLLIILASLLTFGTPWILLLINRFILKIELYYGQPVGNSRIITVPNLSLNLIGIILIICGIIASFYVMSERK